MDENYRREFGSAIRAAEGIPDEDGTLPLVRDARTGRWGVAIPPQSGNGVILIVAFALVGTLIWLATP